MKRIILSLAMIFIAITMNAQQVVQTSKILDNTYVGAEVGAD